MPIAAVPEYLGQEFKDASPGMRFGMYLKLWGVNRRTNALLWTTHDVDYEVRGQDRREREVKYENKVPALSEAKQIHDTEKKTMLALIERQESTFKTVPSASSLRLDAQAVAPFTTGLGNEHPLENGFAFLCPYGLPYLPGSGVKGVVRRAAQELASGEWGRSHGWNKQEVYTLDAGNVHVRLSVIDVLFGREPKEGDSEHVRGALSFWDVIPQIKGDTLMVEIMTPHQGHYYQQKQEKKSGDSTSPHDSGQPTPIPFLTVPPGSIFTFYVVCDVQHLERLTQDGAPDLLMPGEDGKPKWQTLLEAAFEHAFKWLGFGAKTAVGYGAMRKNGAPEQALQDAKPSADEAIWHQANLEFRPNTGEIIASFRDQKTAPVKGDLAQAILDQLEPAQRERLKKKKSLKDVSVRVRIKSNLIELLGLQP